MKEIDLVLGGGGARIGGLVGGVKALVKNGYKIMRVAGTSAGAIIAALISAGYTPEELEKLVIETDFREIARDISPVASFISSIRGKPSGIYEGNKFECWMFDKLDNKGVIYFDDTRLPLEVFATDITNKEAVTFCSGSSKGMLVSRAVRMSMSIPFVFTPVEYGGSWIVDGGLLKNYPIRTFDDHKRPTIGLRLIGDEYHHYQHISAVKNNVDIVMACVSTMMGAIEREHIEAADWTRTITINTGDVSAVDFAISRARRGWLIEVGYEAATKFIEAEGAR